MVRQLYWVGSDALHRLACKERESTTKEWSDGCELLVRPAVVFSLEFNLADFRLTSMVFFAFGAERYPLSSTLKPVLSSPSASRPS